MKPLSNLFEKKLWKVGVCTSDLPKILMFHSYVKFPLPNRGYVCVCMCVCIHVYTHVYIYIYT